MSEYTPVISVGYDLDNGGTDCLRPGDYGHIATCDLIDFIKDLRVRIYEMMKELDSRKVNLVCLEPVKELSATPEQKD